MTKLKLADVHVHVLFKMLSRNVTSNVLLVFYLHTIFQRNSYCFRN